MKDPESLAKLPWHDPDFSRRMLKEHLSQAHDLASRRFETIERQVRWLHEVVLSGRRSAILDLGCGPGFYLQRLAALGHDCTGIDYGPASIAYAKERADRDRLGIRYTLEDVRTAKFGRNLDLIMMLWAEFNTFSPREARTLIERSAGALSAEGQLVLEVHPLDEIRRQGQQAAAQETHQAGLFGDSPHTCQRESSWNETLQTATTRFVVRDLASDAVTTYASSAQAYTNEEFVNMLTEGGFASVEERPSGGLTVFVARVGARRENSA